MILSNGAASGVELGKQHSMGPFPVSAGRLWVWPV
jgi:hypothetical protein